MLKRDALCSPKVLLNFNFFSRRLAFWRLCWGSFWSFRWTLATLVWSLCAHIFWEPYRCLLSSNLESELLKLSHPVQQEVVIIPQLTVLNLVLLDAQLHRGQNLIEHRPESRLHVENIVVIYFGLLWREMLWRSWQINVLVWPISEDFVMDRVLSSWVFHPIGLVIPLFFGWLTTMYSYVGRYALLVMSFLLSCLRIQVIKLLEVTVAGVSGRRVRARILSAWMGPRWGTRLRLFGFWVWFSLLGLGFFHDGFL